MSELQGVGGLTADNLDPPMVPGATRPTPSISVIVATFNSAATLRGCLESVRGQLTEGWVEIIVVDGGSTDGTLSLAARAADRVIHNPVRTELGFAGGKNLGLNFASGEFVAMVDADNTLVEVDYLSLLRRPLEQEPEVVAALPTPWIPAQGTAPSLLRFFCLEERRFWESQAAGGLQSDGWVVFRPKRAVVSNAALLRRRDLLESGGWDFDTEVGRRILGRHGSCFALVGHAHRLHSEVHDYSELWRKLDRRMLTQRAEADVKPAVQDEVRSVLRDPLSRIREELAIPFGLGVRGPDRAYLHALPVFLLKCFLFLARGLWLAPPSTRATRAGGKS